MEFRETRKARPEELWALVIIRDQSAMFEQPTAGAERHAVKHIANVNGWTVRQAARHLGFTRPVQHPTRPTARLAAPRRRRASRKAAAVLAAPPDDPDPDPPYAGAPPRNTWVAS